MRGLQLSSDACTQEEFRVAVGHTSEALPVCEVIAIADDSAEMVGAILANPLLLPPGASKDSEEAEVGRSHVAASTRHVHQLHIILSP